MDSSSQQDQAKLSELDEVFVYGSLKRGLSGHVHMEGTTFVGSATTFDKYLLTSNQYPFLSKAKQLCYVRGEVYKVTNQILEKLDEYEEVPEYYQREAIKVVMDDTKEVRQVYVYFCEKEVGQKVHEDGHYVEEVLTILK